MMSHVDLRSRAIKMREHFEAETFPFPRLDCRKICAESNIKPIDVITYVDLYSSEVMGYCSWGQKILDWEPSKLARVLDLTRLNFETIYPAFKIIWTNVTAENSPELYGLMLRVETARSELHALIKDIVIERQATQKPDMPDSNA